MKKPSDGKRGSSAVPTPDDHSKYGVILGITRREFLDGAGKAIGVAALTCAASNVLTTDATATAAEKASLGKYSPSLQGIRGQTQAAMSVAHALRDHAGLPNSEDTGEEYDLVVVGAGMSGLAAAYYYRKALPSAKILILDGCDDFGGHARRNEFYLAGKSLIGVGGTFAVALPETYTPEGKALLADIGVNAARYYAAVASGASSFDALNSKAAVFFDKETFGTDKLVGDYPEIMPFVTDETPLNLRATTWHKFLARTPLSARAKEDLHRVVDRPANYLPGASVAEQIRALRTVSYADYLRRTFHIGADASHFTQRVIHGFHLNVGAGPDSFSAWLAYQAGCPGFQGLALPPIRISGILANDRLGADNIRFPDGNAGVARLLVRWLIPGSLQGSTMEDSVLAHMDYAALDSADSAVRLRLNSTVVHVVHNGSPDKSDDVTLSYERAGRSFRVRAKTCVLACFNAIVPYLCPELPDAQKEDLKLAVRKPLVWTTVALRNWKAFERLQVGFIYSPGSFYEISTLDLGVSLGGNKAAQTPNDPAIVYMGIAPNSPGVPARDQYRAGRALLQAIDQETYERNARNQLQRTLAHGGFDAERDIVGVTVNRWAHGYACGGNDLYDPHVSGAEPPSWVRGRRRFGRIAIANSDAAGVSLTQAAFDQANRAVRELISDVVRPQFYLLNPEQG